MLQNNIKFAAIMLSIFSAVFLLSYFFIYDKNPAPEKKLSTPTPAPNERVWQIKSIDTMKYSRDLAREKLNDASFKETISSQVRDIAAANANYISIATPYDQEFIPILKLWVESARARGLKIWFRGNFSGWEGWYNYARISNEEHLTLTQEFITKNPDLFEDGDIFSPCPECENANKLEWGDPAQLDIHRQFLIEEYQVSKKAFGKINKNVSTGYFSMNADLAFALMDRATAEALGGVVVVDHYVKNPSRLALDIKDLAEQTGAKIILGEFGAPIPDIHGEMSNKEQAAWLREALTGLQDIESLIGLNYWVNLGGSTSLWNDNGTPKEIVDVIKYFYSLKKL